MNYPGFFSSLFAVLLTGFLIWMLYRGIRGNPEAFQKKSIEKSAWTLGVLALLLIGLIGFVVLILRQS
jgi:hypothetical protein